MGGVLGGFVLRNDFMKMCENMCMCVHVCDKLENGYEMTQIFLTYKSLNFHL